MSERRRELRRRRKRTKVVSQMKQRVGKASAADKAKMAEKLRRISPGAEFIIQAVGLES